MPPPFTVKISASGLQMNIHTYKLNFNSIGGVSHVRELCLIFPVSTS
ncbi:putative translational regulatory protein ArgL [Siccibacter colletis]